MKSKGRVLLVNPWIVDFAAYDFWIKPVGLLNIGRVLKENAYDVDLLDCLDRNDSRLSKFPCARQSNNRKNGTGHFYKEIIPKPDILKSVPRRYGRYGIPKILVEERLKRLNRPDVVFVTSGMTYWYPGVFDMIALLKALFPGVPVVLGGIYATLCPDHARENSGADRVVAGPGETEALRIADEAAGNDSSFENRPASAVFPVPLYDLYPRLTSAVLLTSRGCPYDCPFCASSLLSDAGCRQRDPSHVVQDIIRLNRDKGVREFAFYDDALFYRKQDHIIPILREVVERKQDVHFHTPNGIQPGAIDSDTARLMKASGFQTIRLSYETANKDRQKRMGYKVSDADLVFAVRNLTHAGIDSRAIGGYVMMGLPGQEAGEVLESMLFVLRLGIKVSLASYSLIPGTRDWQDAVCSGLIKTDMDPLLTNNSVFSIYAKTMRQETFVRFGTLSSVANRLLNQKKNPLADSEFLGLLKNLEKSI